jgi:hypothetical protein
MSRSLFLLCSMLAFAGCERRKAPGADMAPAEDWSGGAGDKQADPHAGMDMGGGAADPHAGMDMSGGGGDPHAGVDMGSHGGANPHGETGVKADPSQYVAGELVLADPKLAVPASGVLYLIARQGTDPAQPGPVLAVIDMPIPAIPYTYRVDQTLSKMLPAGPMTGEIIIKARIDQDGDPGTVADGDLLGQVVTKVPADGVVIKLDKAAP